MSEEDAKQLVRDAIRWVFYLFRWKSDLTWLGSSQGWYFQRHGFWQLRRPGGDQAQGWRPVSQNFRRSQRQGLFSNSISVTSSLTNFPLQGERREKYTYPKGATAVLTEKVRDIKVSQAQVGGGQVSFEECDLEYILNWKFPLTDHVFQVGDKNHAYIVDSEVVRPIAMEVA